jgi:hypothetical protein
VAAQFLFDQVQKKITKASKMFAELRQGFSAKPEFV